MNAYQAQRIRFGILAARHTLARDRMTPDQVDYLEACEAHGWIVGDAGTLKAFDRTYSELRSQIALQEHGKKATELRKRFLV